MKNEIQDWINTALAESKLDGFQLSETAAAKIEFEAASRFVQGSPRAWWMALKLPATVISSNDRSISDCMPDKAGRCWFIPESEESHLPVFDVRIEDIPRILAECPFFEYNVIDRDFSWMLSESDHNMFYVCRYKQNDATTAGEKPARG